MTPTIVLITVVAYFALLFSVSAWAGRGGSNSGFFSGGRSSNWFLVMLAMIGAPLSGVTFVSVPGMVQASGFSYMQMALGFLVGQLIIAFVLVPMYYRMQLVSIYGYLDKRFGLGAHKTGAWFFFISKLLGASVRIFLICVVMQLLVFDPFGIPFIVNAAVTMLMVLLYTMGGVKSLVWTDTLKTICLILSIVLCLYFVAKGLGLSFSGLVSSVKGSESSRMFFFDDPNDKKYFFKQFLAGVFTLIATTGLDQDLMQRSLSCKNYSDSQKNIVWSSIIQTIVIFLFLTLGVILYMYADKMGIALPAESDNMFPTVATSAQMPMIVGILFVVGLVSSTYSAAGSALTALTTSFTIDILGGDKMEDRKLTKTRKTVHVCMAVAMCAVIFVIKQLNNTSVIDAVYTLASYTYGPLLGMFTFGICTKRAVKDKAVPFIAIISPVLCYILASNSEQWFNGYKFSYELLIFNALFTFIGMLIFSKKNK